MLKKKRKCERHSASLASFGEGRSHQGRGCAVASRNRTALVCSQQGNWISAPHHKELSLPQPGWALSRFPTFFFFKAKTTHAQYKSVWNRHESVSLAWHPKASHWYQLGIFHSQHLLGTSRHISLLLSLVYEVHIVDISLSLEWQI